MVHQTHSSQETKELAANLASQLRGGEVILLSGDLGAGKTTFTQGLVAALGSVDAVRSPTFTIMNLYQVDQPPIKQVVHLDFYRLARASADDLGLDEWLGRDDVVMVAEWPPGDFSWPNAARIIEVQLSISSPEQRTVTVRQ